MMGLSHFALAEGFKVGLSFNHYSPQDSIYKDIYGKGNLMLGGSLSYEIKTIIKLELRAEANYFQDKGEMTATKEEISFTLVPIAVGLRFRVIDKKVSPYLGAGVDFCSYKEKLPERFEQVSELKVGFHVETGSYLNLTKRFHIDLNVRYVKVDANPFDETIKLGGLRAGIGIGFSF
jgi:opacity protein-like surface antigen